MGDPLLTLKEESRRAVVVRCAQSRINQTDQINQINQIDRPRVASRSSRLSRTSRASRATLRRMLSHEREGHGPAITPTARRGSSWQVEPSSPSVGFWCRPAWAGEDVVEPFQCFMAQRKTQDAYRAVQLFHRARSYNRRRDGLLVQQPGERHIGRVLAELCA